MLIKKNSGGYVHHLLTRLNRAILVRKSFIVVKKLGSVFPILNLLVKEGYVRSYVEYPDLVIIYLKIIVIDHRSESILSVSVVPRYGRNTAIPLRDLKVKLQKTGITPCTILHTDKGLLTSFDAVRLNTGGKGLIQIT